jgi:molybdopterin converting factor small subunit
LTITYLIPAYLHPHAGGRTELSHDVEGATLADALAALWRAHLGLRDRIIDEQGRPRQHMNIFVNNDNSRDVGGLAAPIRDGDEIMIVPNVSGG